MATDTDLMDEGEEEVVKLEGAGMEELEAKSESSTGSHLPPPPPLQRAPQYRASRTSLQERRGEGPAVMVSSTPVRLQERVQREEAEEGVSKLVMKASSGGGRGSSTRRRALIHSIPKFSQVRPTHQLAVAQRLLQERLLQKRGGAAELLQGMAALEAQEQERRGRREERVAVQREVLEKNPEREVGRGQGSRPVRRERKPRKTDICRIQPEDEKEEQVGGMDEEEPEGAVRCLPELTITRRAPSSPDSPAHHQQSASSPLDLSRPRLAPSSPPSGAPASLPPSPSSSLSLVLQPPDYEALAPHHPLYATYIFLPSIGVFVHPLAIPPELAPPQPGSEKQLLNPKRLTTNTTTNNNNTTGFNLTTDVISANNGGKSRKEDVEKTSLCKTKSGEVMLVARQETEDGATFCKFKTCVKTHAGSHHRSSSIETFDTTT